MRKYWYRRILIMAVVFSVAVGGSYYLIRNRQEELKQEVNAGTAGSGLVIPGGMPIGIYLETDGVMVLGTQAVPGTGGIEKEPARNLVSAGDYITAINGTKIRKKTELIEAVNQLDQEDVVLDPLLVSEVPALVGYVCVHHRPPWHELGPLEDREPPFCSGAASGHGLVAVGQGEGRGIGSDDRRNLRVVEFLDFGSNIDGSGLGDLFGHRLRVDPQLSQALAFHAPRQGDHLVPVRTPVQGGEVQFEAEEVLRLPHVDLVEVPILFDDGARHIEHGMWRDVIDGVEEVPLDALAAYATMLNEKTEQALERAKETGPNRKLSDPALRALRKKMR